MATTAIPDGAACFFCLEERGDEEGNSLVRDCSCRGNSGFAHLSCLAMYAEQKCRARDGDMTSFREPWYKCTNCKQPFQNQLAVDLASAFASFAKETYGHDGNNKWDKMRVISALRLKIEALNQLPNADAGTQEELNNKLLSTIYQTKKDLKMNRWVHMPKASEEYQYYKLLCGHYETYAHLQLGGIARSDTSEEGFKAMMTHYKKARAIYYLFGMKGNAQQMDTLISLYTAEKQAANDGTSSSTVDFSALEDLRNMYECNIHMHGINSEATIKLGLLYASVLQRVNRIEAERIFTKLSTISRRVHGPDHKVTINATELLEKCKERYVLVLPDDKVFQALRYENDGEICVVTGPITDPRDIGDERIQHIENNLLIPNLGCPVICHGLLSASHLNGELGEVRHFKQDETGMRCEVFFEKKGVKSALVKPANLRIVFDLSSEVSQFLNGT
jgi:hypothetical protein